MHKGVLESVFRVGWSSAPVHELGDLQPCQQVLQLLRRHGSDRSAIAHVANHAAERVSPRVCHSPMKRRYTCVMTAGDENVTEPHPVRPSTLRVRRHRTRRRKGLRLLTVILLFAQNRAHSTQDVSDA